MSDTNTVKLSAKICAEALLGKVRFNFDPRATEPEYLDRMRRVFNQFRKVLGGVDNFEQYSETYRPAFHVLADLLFDRICNVTSEKTIERIKVLPILQRVAVERVASRLTGKDDPRGHWMSDLWDLRQMVRSVVETSISDMSLEEIRVGFDEFVHALVDSLFDNRRMLMS